MFSLNGDPPSSAKLYGWLMTALACTALYLP